MQLLIFCSPIRLQEGGKTTEPSVQPSSYFGIADLFRLAGPGPIEDMLDLHHPFTHASDLCEDCFFLLMQTHDGFETQKAFLACVSHCSPPFSSFSKLVWILVKASCIANPPYWKGVRPSIFNAPSTIAAYSSRIWRCSLSCFFSSLFSSASLRRL